MSGGEILDIGITTLVLGSIYGVLAAAWVVLFRSTGVLNFATGALVALAGFVFYAFRVTWSWSLAPSILGTGAILVAASLLVFVVLFRRGLGEAAFSQVIITLGLAGVVTAVIQVIWGPSARQVPDAVEQHLYRPADGALLTTGNIFTIAMGAVAAIALILFFRRSRIGHAMTATAESPLLASFSGVRISVVAGAAWALSGACITAAAVMYTSGGTLSLSAQEIGLRGLAPALVGGLDSVEGAFVGGLIVALVEALAVKYGGGELVDVSAYSVLLLFMMVRPHGLFGTPDVRRV